MWCINNLRQIQFSLQSNVALIIIIITILIITCKIGCLHHLKINCFDQNQSRKGKSLKKKIPTVATSEEWIQYHLKKEKKKLQKQQEIEERKKKTIEARKKKIQEQELKRLIKKESWKKAARKWKKKEENNWS